jgi:pimeloyl-ACP methyl ester carboxylesterase
MSLESNRLEVGTTPAKESPIRNPFRSDKALARFLSRYDARAHSWPVHSETKIVVTQAERTFVRISGPKDGPPLVLLPAEWDTSLMWLPVIEALSRNFRTYAVDNPYDFGRSSFTPPRADTIDFLRWLDELFDALALPDSINLMGCSFGAWLTADYLFHAPQRLAKAVWLSPPFAVLAPPAQSYVGGPLSMGALVTPAKPSVGAYLGWLMPHMVGTAWFKEHLEDTVLGLRSFDARLFLTEPRMLSDAELTSIAVPLLYVAGEREQMCSVQAAVSRLNSVVPRVETQIIEGAGHELPMGEPDAVSSHVLRFLGKW